MNLNELHDFDWGPLPHNDVATIMEEFKDQTYERFYTIQPNDIVLDLGASVGPLGILALQKNAKKVIMVEPNPHLLKIAVKNCIGLLFNQPNKTIVPVCKAIGYNSNIFGPQADFEYTTIERLAKQFNIIHVDFAKIDIEGGEYDVFTTENIHFLKKCKHIATEFHLKGLNNRQQFINFRNNILPHFDKWQAVSCRYQHIKHGHNIDLSEYIMMDDWVLQYDCEFMMYFDNCGAIT